MRFLMINLILVCLLLFGIGYLAFGDIEIEAGLERKGGRQENCKKRCGGCFPNFQSSDLPTDLRIKNTNLISKIA